MQDEIVEQVNDDTATTTAEVLDGDLQEMNETKDFMEQAVMVEPISRPTSFAELDAIEEAQEKIEKVGDMWKRFCLLGNDIMADSSITDKGTAVQGLAVEFASRVSEPLEKEMDEKAVWSTAFVNDLPDSSFLYIEKGGKKEDGKTTPRSLRHFPYKDASGKVDLPHLRNAIARIPQSTAPGLNKSALQNKARKMLADAQKEKPSIIDRAVGCIKSVLKKDDQQKEQSPLMVYKSGDTYRWAVIYSNAYRDRDIPAEIVSKAAHEDFARAVDAGEWDYPVLQWWHVRSATLGYADIVLFDKSTNCAWAAGDFVNKGVAEAFAKNADGLAVSHGMPRSEIRRDDDDPTVITRYRSTEISLLPADKAANLLTGFYHSKE